MEFGVDLFWPRYLVVALIAAAAVAHVWAYGRTTKPISAGLRRLLIAVRLAALAVLIFSLWRPAAESETSLSRKSRLAVLVDASRSMSIGDEEAGLPAEPLSRLARARSVFVDNADVWEEIRELYEVSAYSFASQVKPVEGWEQEQAGAPFANVRADGAASAVGDAISTTSRMVNAPEAVLLFSDGLSNAGLDPLDAAAMSNVRVYTVSVGKREPTASTRDVSATGIFPPSEAFVSSDMTVVARFDMTGLEDRTVKVHFKADGREIETKEITTDRSRATRNVEFTFRPEKAGPVRLEVEAEALSDEIVAANNSAATYADVSEGVLTVLYLEGGFRWESKFLKQALESSKDVEVRLLSTEGPGDTKVREAIEGEWDVLIIGDVAAESFPRALLLEAAGRVEDGPRGILFLGGDRALGRGGYGTGPLGHLIPFEVSPREELSRRTYSARPRAEGPYSLLTDVAAEENDSAWRLLAPLLSVNLVGRPRPGASVLLTAEPVIRDKATGVVNPEPGAAEVSLMAVQDAGKGRSAAFAGDGTWQWVTGVGLSEMEDRDLSAASHRRFWRQLVFWLARREETGDVSLRLSLSGHRLELGDSLEIGAEVLTGDLEPVTDAKLAAVIRSGEEEFRREFWMEGGKYRADFAPAAAGDYFLEVEAVRESQTIAEKKSAFVVAGTDTEYATLVGRPALMEAIAKATGGAYAPASTASDVFERIHRQASSARFVKRERKEIWSTFWYAALIIGLLSLEWGLRKAKGLV